MTKEFAHKHTTCMARRTGPFSSGLLVSFSKNYDVDDDDVDDDYKYFSY